MKKRALQFTSAIVGLIVSIATATLCVFAWFTSNENLTGAFNGVIVGPAVNSIHIEAYLLNETTTDNTYDVSYRLGDEMPEQDLNGNTKYAMRAFGSNEATTAILVEVKITLLRLGRINISTQGDDAYQTVIPTEDGRDNYYNPKLSEAVAIYTGVTFDSANSQITFDNSASAPHYMVEDRTYDGVTSPSKVTSLILNDIATSLEVTYYFVLDYYAPLMTSIFNRIDATSGSGSSINSTLNFGNDITFLATDG